MGFLMNSIISPNMNLIIPTAGQEAGPQYALDINSSLTLIDQHDHSAGNGVQITPAGLNINANLPFQGNAALNAGYLSLAAGASASSTLQSVSSAPASSINELWYTDSNGVSTQLTSNGTVNVTTSSITGISYSGSGFVFNQISGGVANSVPATLDSADHTIRPQVASTTLGVTLLSPSGTVNLTLPLQPAATSFVQMDSSGVQSASIAVLGALTSANLSSSAGILGSQLSASAGILGSQIAVGTITDSNIASLTITTDKLAGLSNRSTTGSSYSNNTTSITNIVANTTGTLPAGTAATRPLMFSFSGGGIIIVGTQANFFLRNITTNTNLASWTIDPTASGGTGATVVSPGGFNFICIDPSATSAIGGDQYALRAQSNSASAATITTSGVTMNIIQV